MSPLDDWPFDQEPGVAAITTRRVLDGAPILFVSHDRNDHGWQFLDEDAGDPDDSRVIGMGTALELDASLGRIADLPPGWIAERADASSSWSRRTQPDQRWRHRYGVTGRELLLWAIVLAVPASLVVAVVAGMILSGHGPTD